MDIEYIESHRLTLDGAFELADWQGEWKIGYIDADHGMTNHLMRVNANPAMFRRNNATAETSDFAVELGKTFSFGELAFGVDGYFAVHDSVITNENNAMFEVVNFNDVEDNRYGIFSEWQNKFEQTTVQLGVRLKRAQANASNVSSSMAMMNPMMKMLQNNFNNADRKVSDNNVDVALSSETKLSESLSLYAGVGIKNRAPSYQERYLWMPMESTGGLADGNTYIGNINLKSETAKQVDLGLTYQTNDAMVSPHIFYQSIDDYIQGTPVMLGMNQQLKFSNVDAKLYGVDLNGYLHISEQVELSTIVSYVRGERRDIDDNLYRIAPLNGQVNISYTADNWMVTTSLVMSAKQDKVSGTNKEQKTAGYGVVNLDAQYFASSDLTLRLGIDNVFDKNYQNHLGGYNRVKGTEIAVMSRLPSEGVSAWAEVTYSF
jgi:iron complex outermembrane receptor protein